MQGAIGMELPSDFHIVSPRPRTTNPAAGYLAAMRKVLLYILAALAVGLIGFLFVLLLTKSQVKNSEGMVIAGYSENAGGMIFFKHPTYALDGIDGPYIIGDSIIQVLPQGEIEKVAFRQNQSIVVRPVDASSPEFALKPSAVPPVVLAEAEMPSKLIAVSDIEGNLIAFTSLLQAHGVIDGQYNWTFGSNELVTVGDFMDRGDDVAAVLWLVQKLERDAADQGGRVTFILGNHESMNLRGNWKYAKPKYKALASRLGGSLNPKDSYKAFLNEQTYFGRWLRTRPSLVRRGEYLFVHGGLHPEIADLGLNLSRINEAISRQLGRNLMAKPGPDKIANFLMGETGPLWYRGLVEDYDGEDKLESRELNRILNGFEASRVVIGHSPVDEVSTDYNGRVIRIDVSHGTAPQSAKTQGLLIEEGKPFRIDAAGGKAPLN